MLSVISHNFLIGRFESLENDIRDNLRDFCKNLMPRPM